jgi:hypothetical protein
MCFAEDEDGLPDGWQTYAEEYYERPKGTNSATAGFILNIHAFTHRGTGGEPSFEIEQLESFHRTASVMKVIPYRRVPADAEGTRGALLFNSIICNNLASIGWTKASIKQQLADELFYVLEEVKHRTWILRDCEKEGIDLNALDPLTRYKLYTEPQNIHLICAGGRHPTQAIWLPGLRTDSNTEIVLPSNWDDLLLQADIDLSPLPDN